ncbi:MAG: DNA polymerase IV [Sphaerobacter sp.]|nr:DNA polymerase IV [Sphaerobacter sp.]
MSGTAPWPRVIVHADLDAFFAAAEILRRPELRGKPVIVGGRPGGRGVVAAASYEARAYGVRSAMPIAQAARLCPHAVFLPGDHAYYRELSERFRAVLERFTPLVEMVSVDEAYLDLSHAEHLVGPPLAAARAIKRQVREELGLTVSLGVATSRLVAKIASDLDKPDGLRLVEPGTEAATLAPLPVGRMPGIGPKSVERLQRIGVTTLGGLARMPVAVLQPIFGRRAAEVIDRARGIDPRPVNPAREPAKSVGRERTFSQDLTDPREIERVLYQLAERAGRDLRREGLHGRVVAVKLRYRDFETVGRQRRLPQPTSDHQEIAAVATALVARLLEARRAPVRLLGVRVAALSPAAIQLTMFGDDPLRRHRLNHALDDLAARYGAGLVVPGRVMGGA